MMETGRSWTSGWGSAPLGVVIRVTCTSRAGVSTSGEASTLITTLDPNSLPVWVLLLQQLLPW